MDIFEFRNKFFHGSYPERIALYSINEDNHFFSYWFAGSSRKKKSISSKLNYASTRNFIEVISEVEKAFLSSVEDDYATILNACIQGIAVPRGPLFDLFLEE